MKNQFLIGLLILIAGLYSCSSAYQLRKDTKLDNKAISRAVIRKATVMKPIGDMYNALNPVEAKEVYVKGKETIVIDSIPYDRVHDSLIEAKCPTLNLDSLKKALTKTVYKTSVDTSKRVDTTCERKYISVNNELIQSKIESAKKDGQILELTNQLLKETKSSHKWMWIFIAAGVVILLENLLLLYNFIKPKPKL